MPIGHGFSFFGHGKYFLEKSGHPDSTMVQRFNSVFLQNGSVSDDWPD